MAFFASSALAVGGSGTFDIGETWTDVTVNPVWSIWPDASAGFSVLGSADEGQTWFSIGNANVNSPTFFTGKPVNALKITSITGTTGQTLTVQLTGA